MFFEERVIFRLRTSELNDAKKFVKENHDVDNLSHLIRVALIQYIKIHGNPTEQIYGVEEHKQGLTQTHKEQVGVNK